MSSSLKRDPEESLADRRKRLKAHAEAHFNSTRAAWADLPPDALRLVVKRAADLAGSSVPVVPAVASVCRAWRDAAHVRHPSDLWRRADFSGDFDPSDAVIARYCRGGHWRELEHLDLRDCPRVSDKALRALSAPNGAPALASLFVSDVSTSSAANGLKKPKGMTVDALIAFLEQREETLEAIEIDRLQCASGVALGNFTRAAFGNRRRTSVAVRDAPRVGTNFSLALPPSGAPFLAKLDLSNSGSATGGVVLPWVDLMRKCPAMRELRLNGFGGAAGWEPKPRVDSANDPWTGRGSGSPSGADHGEVPDPRAGLPGFEHLEVLELGAARVTTSAGYGVGQSGLGGISLLIRLTHASKKLRELDVTGARERLRSDDLSSVVARESTDLRRFSADDLAGTLFCDRGESPLRVLRCSKTGWAGAKTRGGEEEEAFRGLFFLSFKDGEGDFFGGEKVKARPRFPDLRVLELGSQGAHAPLFGDEALAIVVAACHASLERLAIAGSAVTDAGAAFLLTRCARVRELDASFCRGMSRETRRAAAEGDIRAARREAAAAADENRVASLESRARVLS